MSYNQNHRRFNGNPNHFQQDRSRLQQTYQDYNFFMTPPPVPPNLGPPINENRREPRRSDQREYRNIQGYQNNRHSDNRHSDNRNVLKWGNSEQDSRKRRHDNSRFNASYSSSRSSFGVNRDQDDGSRRQSYQKQQSIQDKPAEFDHPFESEVECSDDELRMRKMGADGYPPAFVDECVKVSNTLPFFGDEQIYTKRIIKTSDLTPIRGYTHVEGEDVAPEFVSYMQKVADVDYEKSHSEVIKKARRSGLDLDKSRLEIVEEKQITETIRFDIPDYKLSEDEGYALGENTKGMKHNLDGFRDGIQPFVASEPNTPSNFMSKLRNLMSKIEPNESTESLPSPLNDLI
ncbi:unnamed protein product [Bursaphelenchus xylophilus]|uniref:(pine wood nematode) hypothetical protein n=1 Tax=Bursaphelenchus xylophilus TaxID=6326 RepID=A0A7I8WJ47_BURXY|nr:unnamed protein product [Bursaphelenchus xylophilus]CAG9108465.1 unnamed protein product [Bursaphelenchus xylophilus]